MRSEPFVFGFQIATIDFFYYTFCSFHLKNALDKTDVLFGPGGLSMKLLSVVLCLIVALSSFSCSNKKSSPVNNKGEPIVSDQFAPESTTFPGGVPRFVALLKLQSPALLSSATRSVDGTYLIDEALKKHVVKEQQDMELQLQELSPDIRVLFRYRMVLNALAVEAPQSLADKINELEVQFIEADERFELPKVVESQIVARQSRSIVAANSMRIVGALEVNNNLVVQTPTGAIPVRGRGIRVGIIDSGVDYTHAMFGGPGDVALFKAIDASKDTPLFPTAKVVGGKDFVGAIFNTSSHIYDQKIPVPDNNPIDQSGHGSHVAGTVAGVGDGTTTYNGAAPEAELYALKVFGDKGGSTSDTTVIAALEYAADPNQDMETGDRLHIVNLSLGGAYGKPHSLYNLAVSNLAKGGTLAVVAAGNDGAVANIVGSPSTADEALSVAASLDDVEQNWEFPAVEFKTTTQPKILAEAIEGTITKPIRLTGNVQGKLVYIGKAIVDLTPTELAALNGNVALIDRGDISFSEKIKRAIGAIGIVMVNNTDDPAFRMGGDGKFEIPGIMITKAVGEMLKADMSLGDVTIQFQSADKIQKPELIDTLAGFSSQGPRTIDSKIKPEITAPGYNITSAAFGSGSNGTRMSGTSMAAPHVAGLAALLMQYRPELSPLEIKALLMNSSERIDDEDGRMYPISRQGAGRANVFKAATTDVLVTEPALSLGEVQVSSKLNLQKLLTIKNLSASDAQYSLSAMSDPKLSVQISETYFSLAPGASRQVLIDLTLLPVEATTSELDGFVEISSNGKLVAGVPVMAVANHLTQILATQTLVQSSTGVTTVSFENLGPSTGSAYLFELLGQDARKPLVLDTSLSAACDLESVGQRLIERNGELILQLATKIYNPITDWSICDINVEFDFDGDEISDKEIIGTAIEGLPGFAEEDANGFSSAYFDSKKLRDLISTYRKEIALQPVARPRLDFKPAFLSSAPMITFDHSTLAIVEVPLAQLSTAPMTKLSARVTLTYNDGDAIEGNDELVTTAGAWNAIQLSQKNAVTEEVILKPGASEVIVLQAANSATNWIGYFPRNHFTMSLTGKDSQSELLVPTLLPQPLL